MQVDDITILDVKELYDAAFAEKEKAQANLERYRDLMAKAERLDAAYRARLTNAPTISYWRAA